MFRGRSYLVQARLGYTGFTCRGETSYTVCRALLDGRDGELASAKKASLCLIGHD
jgi:hypothetical protein